jgi:hypothetical protein
MGSASLVTFSLAFIIFFICSRKCNIRSGLWLPINSQLLSISKIDAYLYINEIVKWVYMLFHKAFHLNRQKAQSRLPIKWQIIWLSLTKSNHRILLKTKVRKKKSMSFYSKTFINVSSFISLPSDQYALKLFSFRSGLVFGNHDVSI